MTYALILLAGFAGLLGVALWRQWQERRPAAAAVGCARFWSAVGTGVYRGGRTTERGESDGRRQRQEDQADGR